MQPRNTNAIPPRNRKQPSTNNGNPRRIRVRLLKRFPDKDDCFRNEEGGILERSYCAPPTNPNHRIRPRQIPINRTTKYQRLQIQIRTRTSKQVDNRTASDTTLLESKEEGIFRKTAAECTPTTSKIRDTHTQGTNNNLEANGLDISSLSDKRQTGSLINRWGSSPLPCAFA